MDNLYTRKLVTYVFNITFCISIMQEFFSISVFLKLLKHFKLIVKCELSFKNSMQNRTSVFNCLCLIN